jgi:phage baseplate assembly protein V
MLKFGNITEFDANTGYARVKFLDDEIVSDWLQVVVKNSLENKYFHAFDINEQVACLMDENLEDGVILGAIFSESIPPNSGNVNIVRVKFSDDSSIEYNRSTHEYNIDIKGKINIKSDSEVNIETQLAKVDAEMVDVTATNVLITGEAEIDGNLNVTGDITAANVQAGTIDLKTHIHAGVTPGLGSTAVPTP